MQCEPKSDNIQHVLEQNLLDHGFQLGQAQELAKLMAKNDGRGQRFAELMAGPKGPVKGRSPGVPMGYPESGDDLAVTALLSELEKIRVDTDTDFRKKKAFVREMVEVRFKALKKVLTGHLGHVSLFIQAGNAIPSLEQLQVDLHALRAQVEAAELALLIRFNPVEVSSVPHERGRTPDEEFVHA